jgi:hypothetical protein
MTDTWRKHVMVPLALVYLCASTLYDPTLAAAPAVDACTLVTPAEVEQIVGTLKTPPRLIRAEKVLTCEYVFVNEHEALTLWVFPSAALARAKQFAKSALVPVSGFGTGAFLYRDAALGYIELWLKKGDRVLQVMLKAAPGDEEKVKAIATKALGRL